MIILYNPFVTFGSDIATIKITDGDPYPFGVNEPFDATGLQIGVLFVRLRVDDEEIYEVASGTVRHTMKYVLSHLPTGVTIYDSESLAEVLLVADDVSRFSNGLEHADSLERLVAAFDKSMIQWINGKPPLRPFREWMMSEAKRRGLV